MKTEERETCGYLIRIDDNERLCPIMKAPCAADRCAMSVTTEDNMSTNVYCGLVATHKNTAWNELNGSSLMAPWVKCVSREKIG